MDDGDDAQEEVDAIHEQFHDLQTSNSRGNHDHSRSPLSTLRFYQIFDLAYTNQLLQT